MFDQNAPEGSALFENRIAHWRGTIAEMNPHDARLYDPLIGLQLQQNLAGITVVVAPAIENDHVHLAAMERFDRHRHVMFVNEQRLVRLRQRRAGQQFVFRQRGVRGKEPVKLRKLRPMRRIAHTVIVRPPAGKNQSDPMTLTDDQMQSLIAKARTASEHAYCPYSKFRVGAAILSRSGATAAGCNIENASYGLTICAERNAVFQLAAAGERELVAVVVYTPTPTPTAPCGACRQVLNEFGPDMTVICVCDGPERIETKLSELLPQAFGPRNLA